jgi:hypothetical protein
MASEEVFTTVIEALQEQLKAKDEVNNEVNTYISSPS